MPLWTQRAEVSWRQNIAFYEHRYAVLRELEDKGFLRRFQEDDGRISARLGAAHQILSYRSDGLSIAALKPDSNLEMLRTAAEVVCDKLRPKPTGYPEFILQWLVPLDASYDAARASAAVALVGDTPTKLDDFAVVADGTVDDPLDEYHLEFGIVEAAEAINRLARRVGRTAGARPDTPRGLWRADDLPSVAFFCDIELDALSIEGDDIVASLFSLLESARDIGDQLVSSFLKRLDLETT
ncbi:MAG TPA: hypothetical protein VHW01_25780 [Polyangiaceae bacterium]|jgi:hypothetical protein|nr:hypothetical protein [Polyangiaceae bacterium]